MSAPLFTCDLYLPGHDVHWIQAIRSAKDQMSPPQPGSLVEVRADGIVVLELEGRRVRLWHHDPGQLEQLVALNDGRVSYQPPWGLLRTRSSNGDYCFCVGRADKGKHRPCPVAPPTGTPVELPQRAGDFPLDARSDTRSSRSVGMTTTNCHC